MPVVDLLSARLARGIDDVAPALCGLGAREGGGTTVVRLSGADVRQAVEVEAGALRAAGAGEGDLVPATVEPDVAGVVTLLALWHIGAVPAPLNPRLTERERAAAEASLAGRSPSGAQVVLWTSGTGGKPRGVALSFQALVASAEATARRLDLSGPGETWLASLSLAHVGGLALMVRAFLLGSELAAFGRVGAEDISSLVEGDYGGGEQGPVTHLSLVPTQLHDLLEYRTDRPPPDTLSAVLIGGAHAPRDLVDRALAAGWPIALTYGMTEMTSQVATATPEAVRLKPDSVGRPLDGLEMRISPAGEVLVRGRMASIGFLGDPTPLLDGEGWYHTGDLGALDADGDLRLTGRLSDRVISGGVTVDVHEVEGVLREHPSVVDACVVGVSDPRWGERVAAGVVGVEGELDIAELDSWCRERLSPAKRPRSWVLLDRLPLNANGKVDRAGVRALLPGS